MDIIYYLRRVTGVLLIVVAFVSIMVACETNGKRSSSAFHDDFILMEADQEWRELLITTLAKLQAKGTFDEHFMDGYGIALFDLNHDGIPEIIEAEAGGTSGGVRYCAYDLKSGELVADFGGGEFHSGHSEAWCLYWDVETNTFINIDNSTLRDGSTFFRRHISSLFFDADSSRYVEKSLFSIEYDIKETAAENGELIEDTVTVRHYSDGKLVKVAEYHYRYDLFVASHIRLPDTGMKLIRWADVEDKSDTEQSVINMVDALLTSGQKFVMKTK